jgi:predicted RNA-binding protein with PUA-like domain
MRSERTLECGGAACHLLAADFDEVRMAAWLMKSEPDEFSIDDLVRDKSVPWFGVRNYLARNYMRDHMKVGDDVLFYHSSCAQPGVAGLARVSSAPYPDATQFDKKSRYFDPRATPENPRWMLVDVALVRKTRLLTLAELRATKGLEQMMVLQRGNRLSITPVRAAEMKIIAGLLAT